MIVAVAVNAAALAASGRLFSGVDIHGWHAYLIGGAVLGIANAILKPILTILTLPIIVLTLGFFLLLINIGMVALAAWITPDFSIHGFWNYTGTVVIVWLFNWAADAIAASLQSDVRG